MKIERKDDVTVYKIDWKDLVTILETGKTWSQYLKLR